MTEENSFQRYLKTYSGNKLLKEHSLDEEGTWHVFGEDPNCDMGGHHHEPDLGYIEGSLRDVITAAVNIPCFWTWGGGGRIIREETPKAKRAKEVLDRNSELEELLKKRKEIDARIEALESSSENN